MPKPRYVLITGCSEGGIGHAVALEYHTQGLTVLATARRLDSMRELAARGITTMALDVCDLDAVDRVKQQVSLITGGELYILFNNAGQSYTVPATDCEMSQIKKLFDVNVFGVMNMCQTFVPLLKASTQPDGAKIVNIGSIAAIMPLPFGSVYNASKAAIHAYGNTLRVELQPFGIKVITIVTGGVKSRIAVNNHYDIPTDSLYNRMRDLFESRRRGASQSGTMAAATYASKVVSQTLKRSPSAWIWAGAYSTIAWILYTFGWTSVFDRILIRRFGLDIFRKRLLRS